MGETVYVLGELNPDVILTARLAPLTKPDTDYLLRHYLSFASRVIRACCLKDMHGKEIRGWCFEHNSRFVDMWLVQEEFSQPVIANGSGRRIYMLVKTLIHQIGLKIIKLTK